MHTLRYTAPELQPSVKLKIKHKKYREYAKALGNPPKSGPKLFPMYNIELHHVYC